MMDDLWAAAIALVAVGVVAGLVGASLIYRILTKDRDVDRLYHDSARAMAISFFVVLTVLGLVLASSVLDEESFEDLPRWFADQLPAYIAAALILVGGRALALAAGAALSQGLVGGYSRLRSQAGLLVRTAITAAAVIVALAQVGVDTLLLVLAVSALVFGVVTAAALLVGLGGQHVAQELAAGRYLVRILRPGDRVEFELGADRSLVGTVLAMHPGSVEVLEREGVVRHLPNTQAMNSAPRVLKG